MKRFSQLTQTANEADLVAGNFLAIDVPGAGGATKKLPGDFIHYSPEFIASIVGKGNGIDDFVKTRIYGVQAGRKYRAYFFGDFSTSGNAGEYQYLIASYKGVTRTLYRYKLFPTDVLVPKFVDFVAVDNDYVEFGGRAAFGDKVTMMLVPITERMYDSVENIYFVPNTSTYSRQYYYNKFIVGHTYKLTIKNPSFDFPTGLSNTSVKLSVEAMNSSDSRIGDRLVDVRMNETVESQYTFTIPEGTHHVMFGGRSTTDVVVGYIEDITTTNKIESDIKTLETNVENRSTLSISTSSFENTSVSGGYPTHAVVTNRVVQNDLILFPSSKLNVKIIAPPGVWVYFVSYNAVGAFKSYLGYPTALRNGDTLSIDCTTDGDYGYRLVFGRTGNGDLSVADMKQYIDDGLFKIMADVKNVLYDNSVQLVRSVSAKKKQTATAPYLEELPTFLHVSDLHADARRLANAVKIAEAIGVDAVLNSGDSVMYNGANGSKFQVDETKGTTIPYLFCIGNHESRPTGVSTLFTDNISGLVTKNGYLKSVGVDADDCYYYRDFDEKKIRIITLNYYNNGVYNGSLGQTQLDWFVARLLDTPTGYGIVVMFHSPEDAVIVSNGKSDFYQSERLISYQENGFYIGNRPIMKIVDALISRASGTEEYTDNGVSISVSYDFTGVDASTEFICYVNGHRHEDWIGKYRDSSNLQISLTITTGNALYSMLTNTAWSNQSDLGRGDGRGVAQDAVNVYSIDRENGVIRISRIGADINNKFEVREKMILPYRS